MNITIRNVLPSDANVITDVINPIIQDGKSTLLDTPFSASDQSFFIQYFPVNGVFLVAQNTDTAKVVGYQTVEPFASYTRALDHVGILTTYVEQTSRAQGVASALFASTFETAKARGFEKLIANIRADNQTAIDAYLKQGFEVAGTAKKHAKINGQYIDEVMLEKFL
ncbi:GNAT family N-acetyltransferase [Enterovibrio paralichthyis]|uniref:GNAT family N-acetyltransferase n=1 Tax=Enterovibrio paralichthyis TaxID=2853805 RepID=UPI001C492635|nr:GNAT family N-acetyltransferase [Enterovibrio paralichthyis]MBV7298078.1 GNAT family N-acetyltransferase [Enterovibrio paralichthyis]